MKKIIITSLFAGLIGTTISAQGIEDIIRFSQTGLHGSARFVGAGGAFGALGNDYSAIHVNPAGASVFRQSEFGFTTNIQNNISEGTYFGTPNYRDVPSFSLPSFGYVSISEDRKNNKKSAFSLTINRMADFRMSNRITTQNADYSIIDSWVDGATSNAILPDNLSDAQWEALNAGFLVHQGGGNYTTPLDFDRLDTETTIETRGRRSEIGLTYSEAINNKLHWGATLNFINYTFDKELLHSEIGFAQDNPEEVFYRSTLEQRGTGLNVRAGIIYKITHQFRVGASATTPSILAISETYFDQLNSFRPSPIITSTYNVITPANATLSAAYIINKFGFLSLDYNFTNFGAARFGRTSFEQFGGLRGENEFIRQELTNVHNIRIGGEARKNNFFVRGGYNFTNSPYEQFSDDGIVRVISGGIGYRSAKFEINGTIASAVSDVEVRPFAPITQPAFQTWTRTSFLLNLAFRLD
ncbi:MAG: hypothetical protein LAT76_01025 [Schleiferiaceae bacterium]|nr:hypothetical protein [Schleiferiaceae bacterium]